MGPQGTLHNVHSARDPRWKGVDSVLARLPLGGQGLHGASALCWGPGCCTIANFRRLRQKPVDSPLILIYIHKYRHRRNVTAGYHSFLLFFLLLLWLLSIDIQTHKYKYKYTNTNTQIQIHKYKYTNINTQKQIHKYK